VLAAPPAAAHEGVELRALQQVREPLPVGGHAGAVERGRQLVARALGPVTQRAHEDGAALAKRRGVEADLAIAARVAGDLPRRHQLDKPARIGARHELPRATHRVRAHDRPLGDGALEVGLAGATTHAQRDGPLGGGVILRLQRAHPRHDLARRHKVVPRNLLRRQPAIDERGHARTVPSRARMRRGAITWRSRWPWCRR